MKRPITLLAALIMLCAAGSFSQGKFSGYMFGDYYYNIARDSAFNSGNLPNSAVNGKKDFQAFQFRRIYFAYDNDISEKFTSRLRFEADQNSNTTDGKISVAVKDAYLKWKSIFSGSDLLFGISPTPAFDISEAAWGYRSLEKTIMDLRGIVPSRDLGLALRGKVDEDGAVNYWFMVANGAGQKPEGDKYKRYYLNVQVKPAKNLQATLYGDYQSAPDVNDPTSTTTPKATVSGSVLTGAAFIGYGDPGNFNIGAEAFLQSKMHGMTDSSSASGALKSLSSLGISVFGSVNLHPDLALVLRYDYFDPNTDSYIKGDVRNYFLGGLACKPDKNVSIIPNLQVETYQSVAGGRSIDASVTGRLTFYYIFL